MLINHPTDGATCFLCVVCNSNRQVALRIDAMFIMATICISIELYEIVDGASHFAQFYVYCACICANHRLGAQVLTFPLTFAVKLC